MPRVHCTVRVGTLSFLIMRNPLEVQLYVMVQSHHFILGKLGIRSDGIYYGMVQFQFGPTLSNLGINSLESML